MSNRPSDVIYMSMPLYHSAQMHVFLMPYLAVGADNHLLEVPDVPTILRVVEEQGCGALFLAQDETRNVHLVSP